MARKSPGVAAANAAGGSTRVSRAQRTREVQASITASALDLLASTGVDGLALTKIAARAGLSNGPLYGRYDSAEDVALELWESTLADEFRRLVNEFHDFAVAIDAEPTPWLLGELTNPSPLTAPAIEVVAVARRFPLLVDSVRADVEDVFAHLQDSDPARPAALTAVQMTVPTGCVLTARMAPKKRPPWRDILIRVRDASLDRGNWDTSIPAPPPTILEMPVPDTGDAGFDDFVSAVMTVVAKVGFERTTAHRVARAAGHSFSTAYTHVGTKDELMHTAIEQMIEQIWRTGATAFVSLDRDAYIRSVFALQRGLVAPENRPLRQLRIETAIATRHHADLAAAGQRRIAEALAWVPMMFDTDDATVVEPPTSFWYLTNAHGIGITALSLLTDCFNDVPWSPIGFIAEAIAAETTLEPLRRMGRI